MNLLKYEMNRKNFALIWFGVIPITIILVLPLSIFTNYETSMISALILSAITLVLMLISTLRRLENIGKSKLWFLGIFIPLLNLYTLSMIWSYPPNVKENGIDKKGYVIFVLVLFVSIILAILMAASGADNP